MAYSFRITEDYCEAALALEKAGYEWTPRPGDWMLDRDDASVGMLTLPVQDAAQVKRLNIHIPTYVQVSAMLDRLGVREERGREVSFVRASGVVTRCSNAEFSADEGLCRLRALVAALSARSAD
ncbi:hypothetical protein PLCT2_02413 [Planctomycetaceae bacterium]|nr:hypothetical protein PLCT2_02413 [Planctomycetaceae bacterium]